jgi:uncharacterized OsmC-like protein
VEAVDPAAGRRTSIEWFDHGFRISGDNHAAHGGTGTGPDGFDLLAAALGQCLLNTLLARAQADGVRLTSARAVVATKARLRGRHEAPYLTRFEVDLYLEGDVDEATRARLEEVARTLCGVRATLLDSPEIEERVHVGPGP